MSESDSWIWATLGIEPTSDLGAIKRAYAAALKQRRPDEDADAYQWLRQAYDAGIDAARMANMPSSQPQVPQCDNAPAVATSNLSEDQRTSSQTSSDTSTPTAEGAEGATEEVRQASGADDADWMSPESIAKSVHAFWQEHGDLRTLEIWPRVRFDLDRLPLELKDDASAWFASLVLEFQTFPGVFVRALADYFGWTRDFRVDRALGADRAAAIRDRLMRLGALRPTDPKQVRRLLILTRIGELLESNFPMRARALTLLASPKQAERLAATSSELLDRAEVPGWARDWMTSAFQSARVAQLMLLSAVVSLGMHWSGADIGSTILVASLGAVVGSLFVSASLFGSNMMDRIPVELPAAHRFLERYTRRRRFEVALALIAVAALLALLIPVEEFSVIGILLATYMLCLAVVWNPKSRQRALILPDVWLTWALLCQMATFLTLMQGLGLIGVALGWVLGANHLLETFPKSTLSFFRSPLNLPRYGRLPHSRWTLLGWWILLPVVTLAALPLIHMVHAKRFGVASSLICVLCSLLAIGQVGESRWLAVAIVLGLPAMFWTVQAGMESLARIRWFRTADSASPG